MKFQKYHQPLKSERVHENYGEAVDGDEVVTVDHFASSVGNAGQLLATIIANYIISECANQLRHYVRIAHACIANTIVPDS